MSTDHDRPAVAGEPMPPTDRPTSTPEPDTAPERPAARGSAEWVIALDPVTRRFRVDFPDSGSPRQDEEHWLMLALALGLDEPEFRERVINTAFEIVIDRAQSH